MLQEETTKDVLSEETCWTRRSRIPGWRVLEGDNLRLTQVRWPCKGVKCSVGLSNHSWSGL